jgi:preprotein translocase subunit SecF
MKQIIRFSKLFKPAAIFSTVVVLIGVVGYIVFGGFNLGVDFKAGLMQEIQFAPHALDLTYAGDGSAVINYTTTGLNIVVVGTAGENVTHSFTYAAYPTLGVMADALEKQAPGVKVKLAVAKDTRSEWLLQSAIGTPQLSDKPYPLHYLKPGSAAIDIGKLREALKPLGAASVQVLGQPEERRFMLRLDNDALTTDKVVSTLEKTFGVGDVAVNSSQRIGSQYSKSLLHNAIFVIAGALILILAYSAFRFRAQFAIGAVLAIFHDALIMVTFIVWTRMEFNTTTIAAILTIMGYSINDTIVIFDRVRETARLYAEDPFVVTLDRAITETLSRTIITTLTTMLAVLSLFIFTTGSMHDFAAALLVGMVSGCYSTVYIASGFTYFWDRKMKGKIHKHVEPGALTAAE